MINRDAELKKLLLSLGEHVIVSVYDSDMTHKKRRNSKRANQLQNLIIAEGYPFKPITKEINRIEIAKYFIVYGNPQMIKAKLEEHRSSFNVMNFFEDDEFKDIFEKSKFYHPVIAEEKNEFRSRNEIILENLFEPPKSAGGWDFRDSWGDGCYHYIKGNMHCFITWHEEEEIFTLSIGVCIPVGCQLGRLSAKTIDEALYKMASWKLK